mgnify:CR=1 FL=1
MDCDEFLKLLYQTCGIDPNLPVIAGISGGPDSMCLLDLLHRCGVQTVAAHLDHSLRPESASEAVFVANKCQEYGIPFISQQVDVAEYSKQKSLAIEEGARVLRYEFLFTQAQKHEAQAVLVAHHADDQVETVLMHLMRGSGLSGLAGMRMKLLPNPWSNKIPLVRPLLHTWREEIIKYCLDRNLEPVQDLSNLDTRYYRNRIRHDLIPLLQTYNPLIKERLQKTSEVIDLEDDLLQSLTEKSFNEVVLQKNEKFIEFDRKGLKDLHPALMRRILRHAIYMLNQSLRDIEFDAIERGVDFIRQQNRSNQEVLCSGLSIFCSFHDRLVIAFDGDPLLDLWPQLDSNATLSIPVQGETRINDKWIVRTAFTPIRKATKDPYTCQMDPESLKGELTIDSVRAGERFMPFGMNGKSMKMGDFWTNAGLPARARKNWPLLRSGDQIIWVPGFRIADNVRVTKNTRQILQIEVLKNYPAG